MTNAAPPGEGGFTLIEIIIALSLFALVSMGGLALVDSIIRIEERTAGRLERLGQLQRAMFVLTRDLEQVAGGSLEPVNGGIQFQRAASSLEDVDQNIAYLLRGDSLFRVVGGANGTSQLLVDGVSSSNWTFFFSQGGWQDSITVNEQGVSMQPSAVAVDLTLDESSAPSGLLRRVVELPAPPAAVQPL